MVDGGWAQEDKLGSDSPMWVVLFFCASVAVLLEVVSVLPRGRSAAWIRTLAFTPALAKKADRGAAGRVLSLGLWLPYSALRFPLRVIDAAWSDGRGDLRLHGGIVVTLKGSGWRWPSGQLGLLCGVGMLTCAGAVFSGAGLLLEVDSGALAVVIVWTIWPVLLDLGPNPARAPGDIVMDGFAKHPGSPPGAVHTLQSWLNPHRGRCVGVARRVVVDGVYSKLTPRPVETGARRRFRTTWVSIRW